MLFNAVCSDGPFNQHQIRLMAVTLKVRICPLSSDCVDINVLLDFYGRG